MTKYRSGSRGDESCSMGVGGGSRLKGFVFAWLVMSGGGMGGEALGRPKRDGFGRTAKAGRCNGNG